ncbi:fatty-acid amide hydrolase 1-like isoform X1 [Haliotis rufescens]|uniref:fatty-acid amide hydrolase 1-like isoform X1 n=1 Tax=Haliotis rufescens TaxID=6454 RepID=UPI00201F34A3|nr:fatty-acid amide hydrolase 1-like isoform X1 [Haliotis rufescens]
MLQKLRETSLLPEFPSIESLRHSAPAIVGCCVAAWVARAAWRKHAFDQKLSKKRDQLQASMNTLRQQLYEYPLSLTTREYILGLSLTDLQHKLQTGDLKAIDVLRAYQSRALEVDEKCNCVVEPILEAEEWAELCDSKTDPKGPLHGIPVSIKENIEIKGYDCTGGMEYYIDKPATQDAVVIQVLKRQGAIPFMRTNVPQTMYSYGCSNPIYGVTTHPKDPTRSPSGSSGGEGAILGAGGSICGLGTDIGGSVRVPAQMCGVCALKPTRGRLSAEGHFTVNPGQTLVQGVVGPMAQDVEGLVRFTEALMAPEMFALDPQVVPIPFRKEMYESTRPLKIGFYTWDGNIRPVPATIRAVHVAKTALEKMGHKVVSFSPPRTSWVFPSLFVGPMTGDRCQSVRERMVRDYVDQSLKLVYVACALPKWVVSLISRALLPLDPVLGKSFQKFTGVKSVYDWFKVADRIQKYRKEFLEHWNKQDLDAVICPVYPCPAVVLKSAGRLTAGGSYCALYNVLRYSAGSVPVTTVTEADVQEVADPEVYPATTLLEKLTKQGSKGSQGLPVSVQCVCLPYHEEQVLRVMRDVERGLST